MYCQNAIEKQKAPASMARVEINLKYLNFSVNSANSVNNTKISANREFGESSFGELFFGESVFRRIVFRWTVFRRRHELFRRSGWSPGTPLLYYIYVQNAKFGFKKLLSERRRDFEAASAKEDVYITRFFDIAFFEAANLEFLGRTI